MAGIRLATQRKRPGNVSRSVYRAASHRYTAFAQQVIARYMLRQSLPSPVEIVLHPHLAMLAITVYPHTELVIMPRIAPVIFNWRPQQGRSNSAGLLQPILKLRQELITRHSGSASRPGLVAPGAEQIVRRLLSYGTRIETGIDKNHEADRALTVGRRPDSRMLDSRLPAPTIEPGSVIPVTRVVRRLPGQTVDSSGQVAPAGAAPGLPNDVRIAEKIGQQMPKDPIVDVDHLTDQVVQLIDRRIISQRERLGKF